MSCLHPERCAFEARRLSRKAHGSNHRGCRDGSLEEKSGAKKFTISCRNRLRGARLLRELGDVSLGGGSTWIVPLRPDPPDKSKQGGGPLIDSIGTHALDITLSSWTTTSQQLVTPFRSLRSWVPLLPEATEGTWPLDPETSRLRTPHSVTWREQARPRVLLGTERQGLPRGCNHPVRYQGRR